MATELQITCVTSDGTDDDSRIDGVGGGSSLLASWYHTIDQAILNIECGTHRYYTSVNGNSVWVIVKEHWSSGRKYLTTEPDGITANNLSKLGACSVAA
ncbi:MAG: hypothetical protein COA47_00195 [Robiginitomaculum sp.]|nr:MAG: hypothetical protein COA47_00195 [Robiginitomaculum sp.]